MGSLLTNSFKQIKFIDIDSTSQDWSKAFQDSPLVVLACPFSAIPSVLKKLRKKRIAGVICASKGIDPKTLLTFSDFSTKVVGAPVASLSGPTFAREVLEKKPTACVLAGRDLIFLKSFADRASTDYFRIYVSHDPVGVEVCGAVKNVLAIACGISDGLHLGHNARAALLTRGLVELKTLASLLGGKPETVFGLAGVGDLWLTATGDLSRNRQLGLHLAKGESVTQALKHLKGTCEGLFTVKQVHKLRTKFKLDLPISEQVYKICFRGQDPKQALKELMTRELKIEELNLARVK